MKDRQTTSTDEIDSELIEPEPRARPPANLLSHAAGRLGGGMLQRKLALRLQRKAADTPAAAGDVQAAEHAEEGAPHEAAPEVVAAPGEAAEAAEPAESAPVATVEEAKQEVTDLAKAADGAVSGEQAGGDKAAGDKAGGDKAAKPAPKTKVDEGGAKKTRGAEDIVQTYGTVEEADKRQGRVQVYWVDGLKTVEKKGKKHKTAEEVDNVDSLPMKEQSIPVHKKLQPLFSEIFEEIKSSGDWHNILERPWAHNARQNRNNPTQWSVHSWGTAIDVNPTTNPNAPGAKDYSPSERQQKVAKHFTSRGFTWLDDSDAMHFQYHDGGTPKISDEEIEAIIADDKFKKDKDKTFPGTSRKSLAHDVKAKQNIKKKDLGKAEKALAGAEKALAKALGKEKPPKPKALKKLEGAVEKAKQKVAAEKWWIDQLEQILIKLGAGTKTEEKPKADAMASTPPADAAPSVAPPVDTPK